MSTELINKDEKVKLLRYSGGINRGVLYLSRTEGLSKEDTIKELEEMIKVLKNE